MEKIITVGVQYRNTSHRELNNSLNELSRLVKTAGGEIISVLIQKRMKPDPAYLIGEGKAMEITMTAKRNNIRTIVFDEELTPAQQRNLEKIIEAKIIDRTRLILDIFAHRARTKEGELQVELAQLNYYLPRLTRQGIWLDSQVGGIGTRGPGERKIEYERREIRDRIARLNHDIDKIRQHRELQRKKRVSKNIPIIGLIGYTNTGKSTLLNTIVKENVVYADDKLFATLDPTIRRVTLPSGKVVLISDTVGFIHKLPHQLIASFRATLEEITQSTCLVHLVDITSPDYKNQEKIVAQTLDEIGAGNIPLIKVYNKCDLLTPLPGRSTRQNRRLLSKHMPAISAKTGEGLDQMLTHIDRIISMNKISREIYIPYDKSSLLNITHKYAVVNKKSYSESGIKLKIQTDNAGWNKLRKELKIRHDSS
jgi:GTP-binding protein HflX